MSLDFILFVMGIIGKCSRGQNRREKGQLACTGERSGHVWAARPRTQSGGTVAGWGVAEAWGRTDWWVMGIPGRFLIMGGGEQLPPRGASSPHCTPEGIHGTLPARLWVYPTKMGSGGISAKQGVNIIKITNYILDIRLAITEITYALFCLCDSHLFWVKGKFLH